MNIFVNSVVKGVCQSLADVVGAKVNWVQQS